MTIPDTHRDPSPPSPLRFPRYFVSSGHFSPLPVPSRLPRRLSPGPPPPPPYLREAVLISQSPTPSGEPGQRPIIARLSGGHSNPPNFSSGCGRKQWGASLPTCCLAAPSAARPRRSPRGSSGSPSLPLPPPLARLPPQPGSGGPVLVPGPLRGCGRYSDAAGGHGSRAEVEAGRAPGREGERPPPCRGAQQRLTVVYPSPPAMLR